MANSTIRRVGKRYRRTRFTFLLTGLVLLGCGSQEDIRHYKVPKPELIIAQNHVDSATSDAHGQSTGLKYELPAGWMVQEPVSMSVLTLALNDGDRSVQITITPLVGDGGGLLANANRWYRQIGMPEISESDLPERAEQLEVGGITGSYLEAISDAASGDGKAIVGWIGTQANRSWFVKLSGDAQLVRGQRDAYRSFLSTLEF